MRKARLPLGKDDASFCKEHGYFYIDQLCPSDLTLTPIRTASQAAGLIYGNLAR